MNKELLERPDCDICGRSYFQHMEVMSVGRVCPVSAVTYRAPRAAIEAMSLTPKAYSGVVTEEIPITADNLPPGPMWEDDGSCWQAIRCGAGQGCEWRWAARNPKALAKEGPEGPMTDHFPMTQAAPATNELAELQTEISMLKAEIRRCPKCQGNSPATNGGLVEWHIPTMLRWLAEHIDAPRLPDGTLTGRFLYAVAENVESRAALSTKKEGDDGE